VPLKTMAIREGISPSDPWPSRCGRTVIFKVFQAQCVEARQLGQLQGWVAVHCRHVACYHWRAPSKRYPVRFGALWVTALEPLFGKYRMLQCSRYCSPTLVIPIIRSFIAALMIEIPL